MASDSNDTGNTDYYILYCCVHCNEKFSSKDVLKQHMDKCRVMPHPLQIKQEPQETPPEENSQKMTVRGNCVSSEQNDLTQGVTMTTCTATSTISTLSANIVSSMLPQFRVPLREVKTERAQSPVSTGSSSENVLEQGSLQQGRPQMIVPVVTAANQMTPHHSGGQQQTVPVSILSAKQQIPPSLQHMLKAGLQIKKNHTSQYYNAAGNLTASEILRHQFQNRTAHPNITTVSATSITSPSSSSYVTNSSYSTKHDDRQKKRKTLSTVSVQKIKPKVPSSGSKMCSFTVGEQTSVEPNLPRIENVYYMGKDNKLKRGDNLLCISSVSKPAVRSKPQIRNVGTVAVSQACDKPTDSFSAYTEPQIQTVGYSGVPFSQNVAVVESPSKSEPFHGMRITVPTQQTGLQTLQSVQAPQVVDQVTQSAQQIPALMHNPQTLIQSPQPLLNSPPVLLQGPQSLFPTPHGNVLTQSLGQQNMVFIPTSHQNVIQNSVVLKSQIVPLLTPQAVPHTGSNIVHIDPPTIPLSGVKSVHKTKTKASTKSVKRGTPLSFIKKPSSVQTAEPAALQPVTVDHKSLFPVPAPVTMLPQATNGKTPILSGQQSQIVMPGLSNTGLVLLPQSVTSGQSINQLKPFSTSTSHSVKAGSSVDASALLGNQLPSNQILQNKSSNVVLLPPMMSQGHILNGIRMIQSPAHNTQVIPENAKLGVESQHSPVERVKTAAALPASLVASNFSVSSNSDQNHMRKRGDSEQFARVPVYGDSTGSSNEPQKSADIPLTSMKAQHLALLHQNSHQIVPTAASSRIPNAETAESSSSSSLTLTFRVRCGNTAQCTAAQVDVLSETKVYSIAEMLFGGKISCNDIVVLEDARMFIPISYTGPYTPKSTKTFLKKSMKKMCEKNESDIVEGAASSESVPVENILDKNNSNTSIQTISLDGKVVWLFLDGDHPKIVWKVDTAGKHVLVLPLEYDLPAEAMIQVTQMLAKAKIAFPSEPLPFIKRFRHGKSVSTLKKTQAEVDLQKRNTPILPKMNNSVDIRSNFVLQQHLDNKLRFKERTLHPKERSASNTLLMPVIELQSQNSRASESGANTSVPREDGRSVSLQDPCNLAAVNTSQSGQTCKHAHGKPQLTVRADASVIQRALEAVVKLERICLTEAQQQQLKSQMMRKNIAEETSASLECNMHASVHKPGTTTTKTVNYRKKPWCKRLQKKFMRSGCVNKDSSGCSDILFSQMDNRGIKEKHKRKRRFRQKFRSQKEIALVNRDIADVEDKAKSTQFKLKAREEAKRKGKFEIHESLWLDPEKRALCNIEKKKRGKKRKLEDQKSCLEESGEVRSKSPCNLLKKTAGKKIKTEIDTSDEIDVDFVSGAYSETGVRRSVRIFCKPKPDYWLLDNQVDSFEEDSNPADLCSANKDEDIVDKPKTVSKPERKKRCINHNHKRSIMGATKSSGSFMDSPSSEEDSEFDVYIERTDSTDEESNNNPLFIEDHQDAETTSLGESEYSTLSPEEFVKDRDYKELVLKEGGRSHTSEKGAKGHVLYLCIVCGFFQSRSKEELITHLKQHKSGALSCKTCRFSAASMQELQEHEAFEHTGKPLYECQSCQIPFFSQAIFQNHMKRHKSCNVCQNCKQEFPSKHALQVHQEREHVTDKEFVCHLCCKQFDSEDKIRSHYTCCKKGFQCCLCYVKECTSADLTGHMEKEHGHKDQINICSIADCGACFLTSEELIEHSAEHAST